jgi:hypothetical protein
VSNIELPVPGQHTMHGKKRLRRVVPLITAAALGAALIAAAAGPASAAVLEPARTAPNSLAARDNGLSAASESALVASMNNRLDRATATVNRDGGGVDIVDIAQVVPAATPDTTITVVPGVTLTIDNTGIQLSMTKEAVTEVENLAGFGQSVASLVGSILAVAQVPDGPQIAAIVGAALGVGSSFLKLCTAPDGSATFTVPYPWLGLPSCSGLSLVA